MAIRPIPEGSTEIKTGLWLHVTTIELSYMTLYRGELYSAEGYCFYDLTIPENYDEEGKLKPESERLYAQYSTCDGSDLDYINENIISVPVQPGFEIVSAPSEPTETI